MIIKENAKNFDSVFADCTKDELEFDAIFDDADDMLIDVIAGVDEAGIPLTGEDFDFSTLYEEDNMVGEKPDFDYQKDGDASYSEKDAEGTKDKKLEVGGEVGDGKEVSGKENSAESKAYDDKPEVDKAIGVNDKQQTALEAKDEGPLEDDDQAERAGASDVYDNYEESDADTVYANEGAKFTFLPKIKENPQLTKLVDAAEEAEDFLNSNGEEVKGADISRIGKLALRIIDILTDVESIITAPLCITIVAIPCHLMLRAINYALELGQFEIAKSYTKKCIVKLRRLADKEENPTKKEAIEKKIEKLENELENARVDESADVESMLASLEATASLIKEEAEDVDDEAKRDGTVPEEECGAACKESAEDTENEDDDVPYESEDECGAACKESAEEDLCPECGKNPCECKNVKECGDPITDQDDEEARAGKACVDNKNVEGVDTEGIGAELEDTDMLLAALEGSDPIEDCCDTAMRAGACKRDTSDVEGVGTDVLGASILGDVNSDPLIDLDDEEVRAGDKKYAGSDEEGVKTHVVGAALEADDPLTDKDDEEVRSGDEKYDSSDVEGVKTELIGAATEAADDDIDELLSALEDDDDVDLDSVIKGDYIVPDSIQQSGEDNADIKTNESAVDDLVADEDDEDIKMVQDNNGSDLNLEYEDDDDELINAIINGLEVD